MVSVRAIVALSVLLGALGRVVAAPVDRAWFELCQPSDGAGQALSSGASLSFFNPLPRDAGALYLGVSLPAEAVVHFGAEAFVATPPEGQVVQLSPRLSTLPGRDVSAKEQAEFAANRTLVNTSLRERLYVIHLARNEVLPDRFTLDLPPITSGVRTEDVLRVQYRRFKDGGYVQVCGVNGITRKAQ